MTVRDSHPGVSAFEIFFFFFAEGLRLFLLRERTFYFIYFLNSVAPYAKGILDVEGGGGASVVIGVVVLIGRERAQKEITPEYTEDTEVESVRSGESLLEVGGTIGQTGKSAPQVSDAMLTLINPETDDQTRLGAMRKLGYETPQQDIAALKIFLVADIPADVKIPRGA